MLFVPLLFCLHFVPNQLGKISLVEFFFFIEELIALGHFHCALTWVQVVCCVMHVCVT